MKRTGLDARARLAQLAFDWDRRIFDRLVRSNGIRLAAATTPELLEALLWLNHHEPHILREALDETGVAP